MGPHEKDVDALTLPQPFVAIEATGTTRISDPPACVAFEGPAYTSSKQHRDAPARSGFARRPRNLDWRHRWLVPKPEPRCAINAEPGRQGTPQQGYDRRKAMQDWEGRVRTGGGALAELRRCRPIQSPASSGAGCCVSGPSMLFSMPSKQPASNASRRLAAARGSDSERVQHDQPGQ
jgi:hypothetical protein